MRSDQAEIFLTVLEEESIAAAARRLGRSRTTLSTALSAMEDELGSELFTRSGNDSLPTDLAWAIQPDCLRLLKAYRRIQARCDLERQGVEIELRMARDDSLPEDFWRETLRKLKEKFPLTGISVYLAPPQELPALVENRAVDLALGWPPSGKIMNSWIIRNWVRSVCSPLPLLPTPCAKWAWFPRKTSRQKPR